MIREPLNNLLKSGKMSKATTKRNLFAELKQGLEEAREHDLGKLTLRTTKVGFSELSVTPKQLIALRKKLGLSQAVFASYLRTKKRTYEKWEQGETKPNDQAVTLIKLIEKSPDTLQDISAL